jgi:dTDP-4-amino-4,6-dideoxygalactose transaminase
MMATTEALAVAGGPPAVHTYPKRRWPEILPEDREAVLAVLDRGRLSGAKAPENAALEREYAAYLGAEYCLSLNSGTAALHCCAAGAGLAPGDEVIVPAFTFIATAMAIANHGAVPIFCDLEPDCFNLDPVRIAERITGRTRAVLPVHLHGMPADMDGIRAVADQHGLRVIEDSAQAHGATYKGEMVGTLGMCAGTSLQETKNLPGGDGGLFITNDEMAYLAASRLRIFGEDIYEPSFGRYYWSHGVGWNYRNHELSAAFARSQLRRLPDYLATARQNARWLTDQLASIPGVRPPHQPADRESAWYSYRVWLDPDAIGYSGPRRELRDRVLRALVAEGVPAFIWQDFPLPAHPVFRRDALVPWTTGLDGAPLHDWDRDEYPVSVEVAEGSFLLCSHEMPLAVLDEGTLAQYVAAVTKVMDDIETVLELPLQPIERRPPLPHER